MGLLNLSGPALYLVILVAKIIEVSLSTIRIVFVNKGERVKGAILGFIEILIWLLIVSSVLNNITEDPFKILAYALGYSIGNFMGVTIESKIAVGLASLQVVVNSKEGEILADILREQGFGVTIIDGRGKNDSMKNLLFVQMKRKRINEAIKLIQQTNDHAYITVGDIKSMKGGFIKR